MGHAVLALAYVCFIIPYYRFNPRHFDIFLQLWYSYQSYVLNSLGYSMRFLRYYTITRVIFLITHPSRPTAEYKKTN
jgi:hypothetical protein